MNPVQQLDRPDVAVDDSAPPEPFTPTGLKTVLEVIPDHCYERSAWRGFGLVVRDLAIYAAAITGLALTDNPLLLVPLRELPREPFPKLKLRCACPASKPLWWQPE